MGTKLAFCYIYSQCFTAQAYNSSSLGAAGLTFLDNEFSTEQLTKQSLIEKKYFGISGNITNQLLRGYFGRSGNQIM
jgi:hypothetical protein